MVQNVRCSMSKLKFLLAPTLAMIVSLEENAGFSTRMGQAVGPNLNQHPMW